MKEDDKLETDQYLVHTRSQTKSSGLTLPKVHGIDNSMNLQRKPEHQKLVTLLMHQTQNVDKGPPTNRVAPVPKPRIGQGRAGHRRKTKAITPTSTPIQTSAPAIPTPVPRTVQSLPEPVVQSQERTQPWHHSPAPQTIIQPTPTYITQPVRPKIEHRPSQLILIPFKDVHQGPLM